MLNITPLALRPTNSVAALAKTGLNADFIVSGFPEYATGVETLGPDHRRILRDVVTAIARSQATLQPIAAAIIFGHADKALRKPLDERAPFELEISQKRADAAMDCLRQELIAESCGAHYAKVFRFLAIGVGNTRPRFQNAATEQQMQQNRRVEINLISIWFGPPRCGTI